VNGMSMRGHLRGGVRFGTIIETILAVSKTVNLVRRLAGWCSRQRIFLSYSSEDRPIAESIAQALRNARHKVFFDKSSLPAGSDYNDQIRRAVTAADKFIFLATRAGLARGKYTLTELEYAQKKWPSPVGRVYPIVLDAELDPSALPVYLRSVHGLVIAGNAPAEVVSLIEQTSPIKSWCWTCLGVSILSLVIALALASGILPFHGAARVSDVTVVTPEYVHFRPRSRPPDDPTAPDAPNDWLSSPVTLTLPIAYSHKNVRGDTIQLLKEEAELKFGPITGHLSSVYVVELAGASVSEATCKADWLCRKSNVSTQNLRPGETTSTRETMFLSSDDAVSWARLVDTLLADSGPTAAVVILGARVTLGGGGAAGAILTVECKIDVVASRRRMREAGFQSGRDPRPTTWQPRCLANQ